MFGILASAGGPEGLMLVGHPTLQRPALLSLRRTDKREVTLVGQGVLSHHLVPFGAPKISRAQPCFLLHTLLVHLEREHSQHGGERPARGPDPFASELPHRRGSSALWRARVQVPPVVVGELLSLTNEMRIITATSQRCCEEDRP